MEDINIFLGVKAIIFDFDNTLVNFEFNSKIALEAVARDIYDYLLDILPQVSLDKVKGTIFSMAEKLDSEGIYDRTIWWKEALQEIGASADKDQLSEWASLYWSIASKNQVYDDAEELLRYLKDKGYKLAIMSNSDGEGGNKRARIEKVHISRYFDKIIVAGENNIKPKPSVQPFVMTCEELGQNLGSCVYIGDDPVKDCLAASKAGLKSILIDRDGKVKFAELYADFVVRNLKELEEFF
ncbi:MULTISPECIES: HAD family hydrolase [Acidianus]|uniref:2-haloalkanoic acid dehalogenase n=1 Tax=Candidatus Acidianus copahuensis TaxID=1160895 RepID=A0A031LM89_9CREN|nr:MULTISPECIES: HAD family hydrolase [Acidianus]EZQ03867.1 2-haloalkanoic acid dehalogenase [Candidatus Acidianus copahuensis]NON61210.1 HAD family hydrolase [Acidianus sp. RZ1]